MALIYFAYQKANWGCPLATPSRAALNYVRPRAFTSDAVRWQRHFILESHS